MSKLREKAQANPQRVVFPESAEEKILKAACQARDLGVAHPILIGNDEVSVQAGKLGLSLEGIKIIDNTDAGEVERLVNKYIATNTDLPASAAKRMLRTPLNFAAMMVKVDEADCMVAGITHTTGEVILAGQMIVGLKEGISTVSCMCFMNIPGYEGPEGSILALSDPAVVPAPDANELADIAISTADTVKSIMGWEPRVALLSFSTKGSTVHEKVDVVLEALRLVRERRPDILIDGELQLDSAIVPEIAAKKVKDGSPVAGRANVLIYPDLNAGNIATKVFQRFAHGSTFGPPLLGFAKPVCDLSRGAPVEEIVGTVIMAAIQAQDK